MSELACVVYRSVLRRHPVSTLFPYTTLFRSRPGHHRQAGPQPGAADGQGRVAAPAADAKDYAVEWPEGAATRPCPSRSEEHTSELQSRFDLVCRLLLEKKKKKKIKTSLILYN